MMRGLLKLLVVLVICVVGIGVWQGWFSVSRSPGSDTDDSKVNLSVSVDKDKMKADVKKAKEKIKEEVKELQAKAKSKDAK
jgi:hypothetical protein